jgi:Sec-independent protein translocase protein TatA
MADDRKVSLGCGTLILIALIVLIFGNGNRSNDVADIERELRELRTEITQLKQSVNEQTNRISSLERQLKSNP